MKGYIAFCPHFHQPHFQLYKTREEAYAYSYGPWLDMLEQAAGQDGFFINLHFSGPFLYWMRDSKPDFIQRLRSLAQSKRIGIIGGLADEPFIQLSSRRDDFLFQLQYYDQLCQELMDVKASDWQGIHLVERECGEFLLEGITRAANILGAPPIYYLDAETFYESYFAHPGGQWDYCYKHFGFKDPFSKTTISHLPQAMLYFALRDEIGGQSFYGLPVHSQYRYQLLKRDGFTEEDHTRVKPAHYLFYIKDALEQAHEMVRSLGKEIDPILVIFEDAEKFGQWSKDPEGDTEWLQEFFQLVMADEELEFIGLKDYLSQQGFLDTYPVSSSHSYPEWENWMAKRGIRGVTLGDERLRRVLMRLRIMEEKQHKFEQALLQKSLQKRMPDTKAQDLERFTRALLESSERYRWVEDFLTDMNGDIQAVYRLVNRLRNLLYQEDPKWASRHPCYGSSPYYDMQGLAYLELAERLFEKVCFPVLQLDSEDVLQLKDMDMDGVDELWIQTPSQSLCIDPRGACINYHYIVEPIKGEEAGRLTKLLEEKILNVQAYHTGLQQACGMVMTETDSSLREEFYPEGGRMEKCRNAYRAELMIADGLGGYSPAGFHSCMFDLVSYSEDQGVCEVLLEKNLKISLQDGKKYPITMQKQYTIVGKQLELKIVVDSDLPPEIEVFLLSEWVVSAAPSDEVHFRPRAFIGVNEAGDEVKLSVQGISSLGTQQSRSTEKGIKSNSELDYVFTIHTAQQEELSHRVNYRMDLGKGILQQYEVLPAVESYYEGYVFPDQSHLGYHTSGIRIQPWVALQNGQAEYRMAFTLEMNTARSSEDYAQTVSLIEE